LKANQQLSARKVHHIAARESEVSNILLATHKNNISFIKLHENKTTRWRELSVYL